MLFFHLQSAASKAAIRRRQQPLAAGSRLVKAAATTIATAAQHHTEKMPWTPEEDAHLIALIDAGRCWAEIQLKFPGRNTKDRWSRRLKELNPTVNYHNGRSWTPEEDAHLIALIDAGHPGPLRRTHTSSN
eukprot:COSAG05_NODE_100_length_19386_cov_396.467154_14_plen_131_part_00